MQSYGSTSFLALIDSGAEVNVLDKDFAISLNIEIIKSSATAQAANRVPLQVYGQTSNPINLKCEAENGTAMLHLGIVLVVVGLGANCLIGEPAKESNNIICLPKHKLILIANGSDVKYTKYASWYTR